MSHPPACHGRIYHCPDCQDLPAMTIDESWAHAEAAHPEKVTRRVAHVIPEFGLPYAEAGAAGGKATATCPVCGHVAVGGSPKQAARRYAEHFEAAAR